MAKKQKKTSPDNGPGNLDPTKILALDDPGDETQLNFRYQHSVGALLLIAGARSRPDIVAIYCEHHEDLLVELADGTFHAIQVKTQRPENGDWELVPGQTIEKCIGRFVELYKKFGNRINQYIIWSNTDFLTCGWDIKDQAKLAKSPKRFLEAIKKATNHTTIALPFQSCFNQMSINLGCTPETLFEVLKHTTVYKGASKDAFDSVLVNNHLAELDGCKSLPVAALNGIRDELMQRVFDASSLKVNNPEENLYLVEGEDDPRIRSKRVAVSVVDECIKQPKDIIFRYQPGTTLSIEGKSTNQGILNQKFLRAGLDDQFGTMQRRTLSTEQRLIALAHAEPEEIDAMLWQLEGVVQGECDEAALSAKRLRKFEGEQYGEAMLHEVYQRLKQIAENKPDLVYKEPYESLIGVAGLLTEKCTVWWGDKFNLEGEAA